MTDEKGAINQFENLSVTQQLELLNKVIKIDLLKTILNANSGHIGACLSSAELMVSLYLGGIIKFDPKNPNHPGRDRVLVRGHVGPLRYNIFARLGRENSETVMNTYRTLNSPFQGHEAMGLVKGVDITPSGSLGMLLSYGVGSAIALQNTGSVARVFVHLGDGEEQEGNISEAARHAAHLGLTNLVAILDKNEKQLGMPTSWSESTVNIKQIREGYGREVLEVSNGHNIEELLRTFATKLQNYPSVPTKPIIFIVNTQKGHGVLGSEADVCGYHTISSCPQGVVASLIETLNQEIVSQGFNYHQAKLLFNQRLSSLSNDSLGNGLSTQENNLLGVGIDSMPTNIDFNDLDLCVDTYLAKVVKQFSNYPNSSFYLTTADRTTYQDVESCDFNNPSIHYINTGIKEQHLFGLVHGIKVTDPHATICVIEGDTFLLRALDQITASAQAEKSYIILATTAGISASKNGSTHQSVSVPGIMLHTPNIHMYEPADGIDFLNIMNYIGAHKHNGPIYIRLHNSKVAGIEQNNRSVESYISFSPQNPVKLQICTSGLTTDGSIACAKKLDEQGIGVKVINIVNPKCVEAITHFIDPTIPILTIYNGNPRFLGDVVSSALLQSGRITGPVKIHNHGFNIGTSGSLGELKSHFLFDGEGIHKIIQKEFNILFYE